MLQARSLILCASSRMTRKNSTECNKERSLWIPSALLNPVFCLRNTLSKTASSISSEKREGDTSSENDIIILQLLGSNRSICTIKQTYRQSIVGMYFNLTLPLHQCHRRRNHKIRFPPRLSQQQSNRLNRFPHPHFISQNPPYKPILLFLFQKPV